STNTFNLSATSLSQANTNQWPAQSLTSSYGLNHRILCLSGFVQCSAANSGQEIIRFAVSANPATNWIHNFGSIAVTCSGTTPVFWSTNLDTFAFPYVAIDTIENTN